MSVSDVFAKYTPQIFDPKDDHVWREWVDLQRPNYCDLKFFILCHVRSGFKARALVPFLYPPGTDPPIYWKSGSYLGIGDIDLRIGALSPEILMFTADLICAFLDQYGDGMGNATRHYRGYMIQLFELPIGLAHNELFKRYDLGGSVIGENDYRGFGLLMRSRAPASYKLAADVLMRAIVQAELSQANTSSPPTEYDLRALERYIDTLLQRTDSVNDRDDLAEQARFLFGLDVGRWQIVSDARVPKLLKFFNRNDHRDIRRAIARSVTCADDPFCVFSPETLEAAEQMLAEFGDEEPSVARHLEAELEERRGRVLADAEERKRKEIRERELVALMSTP